MLLELRVHNLLLIERAELRLAGGLNVLTGETGAGKTVLAHALDLLLGGRARPGIVRPGASEAYVEGVFEIPPGTPSPAVAEVLAEGEEELVLARRVAASGRTRALCNGRTVSLPALRDVAGELIAFYGQHEHRRLTLASAQLEILDRFCGPAHLERRLACAAAHRAHRAACEDLEALRERAGSRERELDLLGFEIAEIEQAAPQPDEHEALRAERARLRHVEALRSAAWGAAAALGGGEEGEGVAAALGPAGSALEQVSEVDPTLAPLAERTRSVALEAADLASELRGYVEALDSEPGRLEAVEGRLDVLERLARKHGGTVESALAHAEQCRARRAELEGAEEALEEAAARERSSRDELLELAGALSRERTRAAPKLAAAVGERLADLAMEGAALEISLTPGEPGPSGSDAVEMLIAPNPGVAPGPLREIASGGELSRVMLAIMGVAREGGEGVLVFDEVDAGVGGQTARAVGARLRELADGRQVICITHLPQIASLARRHFSIAKDTSVSPARTTVTELADADVVSELVRMLGSDEDDRTARRHAAELRRAA